MDRLAHFTNNVNHRAGKHLALTDYLSKNPSEPPQRDDAYDNEYVINIILPQYKFISLATTFTNQKAERTKENAKQTAIDCLNSVTYTRTKFKPSIKKASKKQ